MAITGTKGTRAVRKKYPVVSGLTSETQKQEGRKENLIPQKGTLYPKRLRKGF